MAANYSFDQNYDSDDEDNETKFIYDGKDIVVYVIDAQKSMFVKEENEETNEITSPFDLCLGALDKVFRDKIRQGTKDLNGIILYNTEKSPDPKDGLDSSIVAPSHCAVFIPPQKAEADMIRYIKNTKESDDYNDFANRYGHSTNAKISDVLWLCNSVISHCAAKVHSLTIFWLTNEDYPHTANSTAYNEAMEKAKDLQHLQMHFELCPMKIGFNVNSFYSELMAKLMNTEIDALDVSFTLDEMTLKHKLLIHDNRSRALSYITVEISENAKFGVGIYSELSKAKEPKAILVDRKTKEIIKSHRNYKYGKLPIDDDDEGTDVNFDQKLTADKAVKYLEIGGKKVKFTPLEVYEMKQVMLPKIKILGFKPVESFNPLTHKRSGYFIYPNEKHIKNSTKMFRALWETCLNLKKIAFCTFSMRYKSYPQLAVLIPQVENEDMLTFDGFQLEFIPYSEDIRDISKHLLKEASESDEIDTAVSKIISNLTIKYDPMLFKNPYTSVIYNKLEQIEFDEEPQEFEDSTNPDVNMQDERIGEYVQTLSELLGGFAENQKRKAPKSEDAPSKKAAVDVNCDKIYEMCKKNDTKGLNVELLKNYLKSKNVSGLSKLKKNDLIAQVLANP